MIRRLALALVVALPLGCATANVDLAPTQRNPGSTGHVTAKTGRNGNTQLAVKLDHLPEPQALDPSLTTYVVWVRPQQGGVFTNMGQVRINDKRQGRLDTTTPYQDFFVVVTAEDDPTAPVPSNYVVLRGEVER